MKLDRLLAITMTILNRGQISAKELSECFEVSLRTIYRDIDAINLAGIPIVSYRGNNGGFAIMEGYKLEKHLLDGNEVASIITALKGLDSVIEDKKISTAIEKVKSLVPQTALEPQNSHVVIDFSRWDYNRKEKDFLKIIKSAIANNNVISFSYTNTKNESTDRKVDPVTIIFKNMCWYLYGYCHIKSDYRMFKLSRMRSPFELDEKFTPHDIAADSFPWEMSLLDNRRNIDIMMKFSPIVRGKVEEFFEEHEIEYLEDGYLIVKVSYPEDEWVYSMILSYGCHVEVIEPPHLRQIIAQRAKKIVDLYQ